MSRKEEIPVYLDYIHFNWVAIVVAAAVFFVLGAIWYAPPVFGKAWSETAEMKPTPATLAESAVVQLVAAVLLAVVLSWTNVNDWTGGVWVAAVGWGAFAATAAAWNTLFERHRARFVLINATYQLLGFVVMGAIIGQWQ